MAFDREKFKTLVHYICSKCEDPRKLGAVKLNKIIWFAEKSAYLRLGEPMTGARFVKRDRGPVPAAILPVLGELAEEQKILVRETHVYGKPKREFISLREPDIDTFSAKQISILDGIIDEVCNHHTAASISASTHDEIWSLAKLGEDIPLYAVFGMQGEITEDDVSLADIELEKRGLVGKHPVALQE